MTDESNNGIIVPREGCEAGCARPYGGTVARGAGMVGATVCMLLAAAGLIGGAKAQCGSGECSDEDSCFLSCDCRYCSAGWYCPGTFADLCVDKEHPCAAGSYSNSGAGSCIYCGSGKYQPNSGHSSCISCTPGFYDARFYDIGHA